MRIRSTLSHHLALASLVFAISVVLLIPAHGQLRVEWITQYGSSADDYGRAITVDTLGQSWVNGTTTGDLGGANARSEERRVGKECA